MGRYKIDVDILIKVQRGSDAGPRHEYECVLDLHYLSNEITRLNLWVHQTHQTYFWQYFALGN